MQALLMGLLHAVIIAAGAYLAQHSGTLVPLLVSSGLNALLHSPVAFLKKVGEVLSVGGAGPKV